MYTSQKDMRAIIFPEGFQYTKGGKTVVLRWDEVEAVHQRITRQRGRGYRGTSYHYTVRGTDGTEVFFDNLIAGVKQLGETIQREVTKRMLPRTVETYNAGDTVSFGKLSVSKEGLSNGEETLPWNEVKDIKVDLGRVSVKKADKWLSWEKVRVADVPNVFVFLALVKSILGTSPE